MPKKHFTLNDRINLQAAIHKGYSCSQISKLLGKHRTTIYREILNNSVIKEPRHTCGHCSKDCIGKHKFINRRCPYFIHYICPKLLKFPFTCHGCKELSICAHFKRFYDCLKADENANYVLKESRRKRKLTKEEIRQIDETVSPKVIKGQSLHHIYVANPFLRDICSERTIRRLIYAGELSVKCHELRRYVRYNHKIPHTKREVRNVEILFQRTFSDYLKYCKLYPNKHIVQYDSVEGNIECKKWILTIIFPLSNFQFGLLIRKGSAKDVLNKMQKLIENVGKETFKKVFPINLSDNGIEFYKFHEIEVDERGEKICHTFFTNVYRSTDKAECERNHQFIRYVIPKGKNFDRLSQEKVDLLFSHINSYVRESKKDKTPYEPVLESFGQKFLESINIQEIPLNEVNLKPDLLR